MSNLNPDFQDFDFILPSYNPFNLDKGLKSFVIGSWDHIVQNSDFSDHKFNYVNRFL